MRIIGVILLTGALIVFGLLCSFLIVLGLNKKKIWREMENIEDERK